jgi:hypothetical protein
LRKFLNAGGADKLNSIKSMEEYRRALESVASFTTLHEKLVNQIARKMWSDVNQTARQIAGKDPEYTFADPMDPNIIDPFSSVASRFRRFKAVQAAQQKENQRIIESL